MKRTVITLLLAATAFSAGAQTMYDALKFSENNYEGTARTMAMGNAFTALGGDLGSININPAGSAVAKYSQITITPGAAISVNKSGGTSQDYFQTAYRTPMARFTMPNVGFSINVNTNRVSGLKNWSLGFVANKTNTYHDNLYTKGLNSTTTFSGALATLAAGINVNDLTLTDNYDPYYDSNWPFDVILGYESGIITPPGETTTDADGNSVLVYPNDYVGVAENYTIAPDGTIVANLPADGSINQIYSRRVLGSKYDYVFNLGFNFSDVVYFGANLGITSINYNQEYYIRESSGGDASDHSWFQTQFNSLRYNYMYSATGVGVYGKFGVIIAPKGGLRIGAAIQTPTATTIRESWSASAEMSTYSDYGSGSAETPESKYEYSLTSPFRFNLGLAYTLGNFGVLSADYEMADYSRMRVRESDSNDNTQYESLNADIRDMMGSSHALRLGLEVKPASWFAVRAGYGLTTSPEKYYDADGILTKAKANVNKFSVGLGFSSNGSFFADIALQANKYAKEYIYPYDYYVLTSDNEIAIDTFVNTPEILSKRWLLNAVITLGFRF